MNTVSTSRDVGIDALRIVCMVMVLMLHILDATGALTKGMSVNYIGAWGLEFLCYSAVNCFVLISGYVGFGRKHRKSKILLSWLQVLFYAVASLLVFLVLKPGVISGKIILKSLLPVTSEAYWFYTVYFALLFAMPLLDHLIETLPEKQLKRSMVVFGALFSVGSILSSGTIFGLNVGGGLIWFIYLYSLGAYFKKYDPFRNISRKVFAILFGASVLMQLGYRVIIELVTVRLFGAPKGGGALLYYCNVLVLVQAVCLFFLFRNYYTGKAWGKVVNKLGMLFFGVYLFHANTLIWVNLLKPMVHSIYCEKLWFTLFVLPLLAAAIYFAGVGIEWVRLKLFKLCKIDSFISRRWSDK
ncbi:MAG: acyltransferase [Oscillospiraceae bacterium]|nr:acyltransferase [Oscillospiraceae bacterium]